MTTPLTRLGSAGLIWPTLAALGALCVLISLGTWQMHRKTWKEGLIAAVAERARLAPVPIADVIGRDPTGEEFRRVTVTGTFMHAQEFHVWAPQPRAPAWSVVTPLLLAAPVNPDRRFPTTAVLVIRGIVPEAAKSASARPVGQVAGPVTLTGRIRLGGVGRFDGKADTARNQWFAYDLATMRYALVTDMVAGSATATPEKAVDLIAPFYVETEVAAPGSDAPTPRLGDIALTNRHLEYALTWFGLAATLIGVYFAFGYSRFSDKEHRSIQ